MRLFFLFLILQCIKISKGQEITSTGGHASNEFSWAVGVDNLSFNVSFTGVNSSNYYEYPHYWYHVSTSGLDLVTFTVTFNATKTEIYGVVCYHGIDPIDHQQTASAYGVNYRIDCTLKDTTLESQFTVESSLNSSYNGSMVKVAITFPVQFNRTKDLELKNCDELKGNKLLNISGGTYAEYDDVANYTCLNSTLVVNNNYDNSTNNNYSRTCNYDANWSCQGNEVDCWFAPKVNVSIKQNGNMSNGTLVSGNACTMICDMLAQGNPTDVNTTYYKTGMNIGSNNFVVEPKDNGASIYCQMANDYVNDVDSSAGRSQSVTLDVLYPPEPNNSCSMEKNSESYLCAPQDAEIGQNHDITIQFNANPTLDKSDTKMYYAGIELESSNASISHQEFLHTYKYHLAPVTNKSFGTYTLWTKSPAPQLQGRVTNFTVYLNDSALEENGLKPGIIAAIAVGGILIIVLLVIGGICIKKRRSPKSNSTTLEERDNPLYGTTMTNRLDEEYANVNKQKKKKEKEEKVNPLYESTRETNGTTIEPAYGSVGQEEDSNEAGPSSSAMNPNTSEVTYAAVNKPKKNKKSANIESVTNQESEVTYAAVNKPKKKDKAETSNSTMDPNTSEVTYAAVNKPKKNK